MVVDGNWFVGFVGFIGIELGFGGIGWLGGIVRFILGWGKILEIEFRIDIFIFGGGGFVLLLNERLVWDGVYELLDGLLVFEWLLGWDCC